MNLYLIIYLLGQCPFLFCDFRKFITSYLTSLLLSEVSSLDNIFYDLPKGQKALPAPPPLPVPLEAAKGPSLQKSFLLELTVQMESVCRPAAQISCCNAGILSQTVGIFVVVVVS